MSPIGGLAYLPRRRDNPQVSLTPLPAVPADACSAPVRVPLRFRLSVLFPAAAAALIAVLAADLIRAQAPTQPEPAKTDAQSAPPAADDYAARAIDQHLIAEAKDRSEIMKNLTYVSDV